MRNIKLVSIIVALLTLLVGCKENIDTSSRYVFKEHTIADYLSSHEQYSEYCDLLKTTPVSNLSGTTLYQLLSARGHYTVFAPTNNAIHEYLCQLTEKGIISTPEWDSFADKHLQDSIRKIIVFNSIINGGDNIEPYETAALPNKDDAEFELANLYDRKLTVRFDDKSDTIFINNVAMDPNNRDIMTLNGLIHSMYGVLAPTNNTLGFLLDEIVDKKEEGFYVMAMMLNTVGLKDTLYAWRDDTYETKYQAGLIKDIEHTSGIGYTYGYCPEHRYYGYTLFAEPDEFWRRELNKEPFDITPEDIVAYLQSKNIYAYADQGKNYKDENNILNLFVTYHLMPIRLAPDRLVIHYNEKGYLPEVGEPTVSTSEYYTSMGHRRLIKFTESKESNGIYINRFAKLDNGRHGTYHELYCDPDKEGIYVGKPLTEGLYNVRNALIYPIDKLLTFDEATRNNMHQERIRYDVASMIPELMNNDIRCRHDQYKDRRGMPVNSVYKYMDDVDMEDDTYFFYYNGWGYTMQNYQGDELNIRGNLDITFRLPPVPADGIYELRFDVQSNGYNRGMVQFYWGNDKDNLAALDIPLDIRMSGLERRTTVGTFPSGVGWLADTEDDDYNAEIDKRMRNNGFMKGAEIYANGAPGNSEMARAEPLIIRRILLRQPIKADETYYMRFKTVLDDPSREFYMDFLEYCPKEVYDNPNEPEDIW